MLKKFILLALLFVTISLASQPITITIPNDVKRVKSITFVSSGVNNEIIHVKVNCVMKNKSRRLFNAKKTHEWYILTGNEKIKIVKGNVKFAVWK